MSEDTADVLLKKIVALAAVNEEIVKQIDEAPKTTPKVL